ncbi:MAG TPA: hypothetical protein PLD25_31935 [Chloroflexota bacterium]|nr:hypothetical protein [Chloroflexota bacterium]HUM67565.1 hypothetical protein [Chloroflexota bacterium]
MNTLTSKSDDRRIVDNKLSTVGLSLFLGIAFTFTWLILGLATLSANHLINVTLPATLSHPDLIRRRVLRIHGSFLLTPVSAAQGVNLVTPL